MLLNPNTTWSPSPFFDCLRGSLFCRADIYVVVVTMNESSLEIPPSSENSNEDPQAQFVLEFLRKRGLDKAALELQKHVESKKSKMVEASGNGDDDDETKALELFEKRLKIAQSSLSHTIGGGYGYDLDSGGAILPWAVSPQGTDESGIAMSETNTGTKPPTTHQEKKMRTEALAYVKSFEILQSWVLSLPDDQYITEPVKSTNDEQNIVSGGSEGLSNHPPTQVPFKTVPHYHTRIIPASCKFELLSLCFPLFVYIYCDLLACGLDQKSAYMLQTYRHVYEPTYSLEIQDLQRCNSTQTFMDMNRDVKYATDVVNEVQIVRSSLQSRKQKKKELESSTQVDSGGNRPSTSLVHLDEEIQRLESALRELSRNAVTLSKKLQVYPFLQKIGLKRSNIVLSQLSYFLLSGILNREALVPMGAMLQSRCYISVQRRDPLPYTPPCVFEESLLDHEEKDESDDIDWAAPIHPLLRAAEAGDEISNITSILNRAEELPFPRFFLRKEYDSNKAYEKDKSTVDFNRALLVHGFRRLEALEIKTEYDNGTRKVKSSPKENARHETSECCNALSPSILLATLCNIPSHSSQHHTSRPLTLDGPNIGITCAKMCPPDGRRVAGGCEDSSIRIWSMEALTSKYRHNGDHEDSITSGEACTVLMGHKNGFPVYDVDWNRDGRTLLSAGGDGTLRLWDSMAVGPFGRLASIRKVSHLGHGTKSNSLSCKNNKDSLHVPGEKSESLVEIHGAALACYHGHSVSTPIWSAAFAPCGYYFASAGADSTARLWCTDRPAPIRIFSGHFNPSVNCVTWHPNCNYILSSGDDRTVRMWDIQTGRCVRLLTGASSGIGVVKVCPSGKFAAGADYSGIVHIWELGSGKKVNELRHALESDLTCSIHSLCYSACGTTIATGCDDFTIRLWDTRGIDLNTMESSSCHVNIKQEAKSLKFGERVPVKTFKTRRTSVIDLQYSKRNLLFAVGKYS